MTTILLAIIIIEICVKIFINLNTDTRWNHS